MVSRTVLKVHISSCECKKKLIKAVSMLEGIDKIEVDAAKETLTVTGNVDPYEVVLRARKAGRYAEVVSIGPPPPPPKPEQKKPDEKKTEAKATNAVHDPHTCLVCQQMVPVYVYVPMAGWDEPNPSCSIM